MFYLLFRYFYNTVVHNLKFLLSVGEIAVGSQLAPILAPFGLNLLQLGKAIDVGTMGKYKIGTLVGIVLYIDPRSKQYKIVVKGPSVLSLIGLCRQSDYRLQLSNLTDPIFVTNVLRFSAREVDRSSSVQLLGTLSAFKDFKDV